MQSQNLAERNRPVILVDPITVEGLLAMQAAEGVRRLYAAIGRVTNCNARTAAVPNPGIVSSLAFLASAG